MINRIFNIVEKFSEQQVTTDDQASATLSSLAVNGNDRLSQKRFVDVSKLLSFKLFTFEVAS